MSADPENSRSLKEGRPPHALVEIDGLDALDNRKSNPSANWGARDRPNRVEPFATPSFETPFQFVPGEKIFTIGSCFARNIEGKLHELGFEVPVRSLFRTEAFRSVNPAIINNFGTPSIFNELAWALDPAFPYDVQNNILEVSPGKFVDLHVVQSERPGTQDDVVRRRNAITEVTRRVTDCRIVIITLGLVELWYDRQQGLYLNAAVLPSLVKAYPGRFVLRVLDFSGAKLFLDRAFDLLKRHSRGDQQILLTVSPVALGTTFRRQDVMVANSYSKSLLRVVAEHACIERENVHYFPSYESAIHSDRNKAWMDDFIHVTDEIVRVNVTRMVAAFTATETQSAPWANEITSAGTEAALLWSNEYLNALAATGEPFFDYCQPLFKESAELAYRAASAYFRWGRMDKATAALVNIPTEWEPAKRRLLAGRILARMGDHAGVIAEVAPLVANGERLDAAWLLLVAARARHESIERGRETLMEWLKVSPKRGYQGLTALADAVVGMANGEAAAFYERAFAIEPPQPRHAISYAEVLIRENRIEDMRRFLETQKFEIHSQERRRIALLATN